MNILQDRFGRQFSYLRLSLTDACNFHCQYCLPAGYEREPCSGDPKEDRILGIDEIDNLVRGCAQLGFKKVRLTGGEPTLRHDIVEVVQRVANVAGIETVALTTNGYRLDRLADPLKRAGLGAINISLDSLNPVRFEMITGSSHFQRVYQGMHLALHVGITPVKINVVILKSYIEKDLAPFLELVSIAPVTVRFIELMETRDNTNLFRAEYFSGEVLGMQLQAQGWRKLPRGAWDGPACELEHPEFAGRLGIIAPYSQEFCANCNRLRVSSRGKVKLCLFGSGEYSIRGLLQSPDQCEELTQVLRVLIGEKVPSHQLHYGIFGNTRHFAKLGG